VIDYINGIKIILIYESTRKHNKNIKKYYMRIIITETQYRKFLTSSPKISDLIKNYLNTYISKGKRKIGIKSRNYGNLREDWCVNGKETITAIYYFDDEEFINGVLLVSKSLIDNIQIFSSLRKSYVIQIVEEWYDETMVPEFEKITGESGLYITDIDYDKEHDCIPEPTKPEGITDEEMIDFIDKNTAYRRDEIIDKIKSGERDLEDFYLDIVDTIERKKQLGF